MNHSLRGASSRTARRVSAGLLSLAVAGTGAVAIASTASAAAGCQVSYTVASQWAGGFVAAVDVKNLGDPVSSWTVGWTYPSGQTITSGWNATVSQSGSAVTASNVAYNGSLGTGASTSFGVQGTFGSSNTVPTAFTLNGVACTGTSEPTPTTTATSTPTPTPTQTSNPQTGIVGWASQNGGTTGGGSASPVTVTSFSSFLSAVSGDSPKVVKVSGTLSCSGMNKVGSNTTILGVGSSSGIKGCGLTFSGVKNVIVQNMNFDGWDDDAINVEQSAMNIWFDHNTFGKGYDGALDIKRGSDYVTVSWNRFNGQDKNMLLGHSDDNASQDTGHLRVSYHHNYFNGTNQRNPRVRFGNPVHVFNNYYASVGSGGGYGVASTEGAGVLVEGNYFENTQDTYHLGEGSSSEGYLLARDNYFVNSPEGQQGGASNVKSIPYSYTLDQASSVKSIVSVGAGAGNVGSDPTPTQTSNPTPTQTSNPTPTQTSNPTPTQTSTPQTGLVGWATQNGGTTGGGSAAATTVTSMSALASAASGDSAKVIKVSGTLSCSGMYKVGSNTTILGVGSNAAIKGCGLNVSNVKNVIIRNIAFSGWDDDAINIETSTNVWVDHNSFTDGYDGAVDTKRASDYVTISWNHVFGHGKSMLLGHSDGNSSQDSGHLRVTYHHNYFDGSGTRHPRVRFGNPVHVYNNYYRDNEYGVASTCDGGVLVEGNYFEGVDDPTLVGYAGSPAGTLVQRNNYATGSGTFESSGSVASIPYSYSLDTASSVKSSVTAGAGAGKI